MADDLLMRAPATKEIDAISKDKVSIGNKLYTPMI